MSTPEIMFPHLDITINHLNRTAFSVFGLDIYWYGIIITTAIILGICVAYYGAKGSGQNPELYIDFAYIAIPACIIGARIYFVVFAWNDYKDNLLNIFNFRLGGLAIYGGVIIAFITAYIYTKVKKINFWSFGDTAIVPLVLGQSIGRWGNFFNKEAFGGYTDSFLAMRLNTSVVDASNITQELYDKMITFNGATYIQVHPTFLYESLWNLTLFVFLFLYRKHKKFDGELVAYYMLFYGIGRFWIEGLRTDQLIFFGTGLPVSQLLSVCIVIFAICFLAFNFVKLRKNAVESKNK